MGVFTRFKNAWNVFKSYNRLTAAYSMIDESRYASMFYSVMNDGTLVNVIYNKIAVDCSMVKMVHCHIDDDENYKEPINSLLNFCLSISSNIDQTGKKLIEDIVYSMLDEGVIAVVPIDGEISPSSGEFTEIYNLRVGKILQWYNDSIEVELYDDTDGRMKQLEVKKERTAIIENPFWQIMNANNPVLTRLKNILKCADNVNSKIGSKRLDLIFQLPYAVRGEIKKNEAKERKKELEDQLTDSGLGLAYIDGIEKIIQLNRPVENTLQSQVEYYTNLLMNQFGVTQNILNGTATEEEMINYRNKTIEPILTTIAEEMTRKFLSKNAITRKERIMYVSKPFGLVPAKVLAELADKFVNAEVMTSNEVRSALGLRPSNDPRANELINKNINPMEQQQENDKGQNGIKDTVEEVKNEQEAKK